MPRRSRFRRTRYGCAHHTGRTRGAVNNPRTAHDVPRGHRHRPGIVPVVPGPDGSDRQKVEPNHAHQQPHARVGCRYARHGRHDHRPRDRMVARGARSRARAQRSLHEGRPAPLRRPDGEHSERPAWETTRETPTGRTPSRKAPFGKNPAHPRSARAGAVAERGCSPPAELRWTAVAVAAGPRPGRHGPPTGSAPGHTCRPPLPTNAAPAPPSGPRHPRNGPNARFAAPGRFCPTSPFSATAFRPFRSSFPTRSRPFPTAVPRRIPLSTTAPECGRSHSASNSHHRTIRWPLAATEPNHARESGAKVPAYRCIPLQGSRLCASRRGTLAIPCWRGRARGTSSVSSGVAVGAPSRARSE